MAARSASLLEHERRKASEYNKLAGGLSGPDCAECRNKGHARVVNADGTAVMRECGCMARREAMRRIERSGLKDQLSECTFDSFRDDLPWQKLAKQAAMSYLDGYEGKWFFAGGQVGAGKTHLCTAIVGGLLGRGMAARYMLWRDETVRLKALVTDEAAYGAAIAEFKGAEALYIDDFLKPACGREPSAADVGMAFELLNHRYNNRGLPTIISSERLLGEILDIDEAVGSRIYQRSKGHCLEIGHDAGKNYRLHGQGGGA